MKYKDICLLFLSSLSGTWLLCTSLAVGSELVNEAVTGKVCWFHLGMAFLSVVTILIVISGRGKSFNIFLPDVCVLLFSGITLSTYNWALNPEPEKLLFGGQLLLFWFMLRFLVTTYPQLRFYFQLVIMSVGLTEAVWGICQLYGYSPSNHSLFRLTGSFFNPGPYSGFLAVVLPVGLYTALTSRFVLHYFAWICVLAIIVILPAGMSRSSWMATILSCVWIYGIHRGGWEKGRVLWTLHRRKIIGFTFILLVIGVIAVSGVYHLKKASADGRLFLWKITTQAIAEHPFTGTGLGGFPIGYAQAQAAYFASSAASETEKLIAGCPEYAFNEYLQIGLEQGLLGLAVFLVCMGSVLHYAVKHKQYSMTGGIISLLVFAFSSYPLQLPDFWVLLIFLSVIGVTPEPSRTIKEETKKRFPVIILCVAIVSIVLFSFQAKAYDTYKQWKVSQSLYRQQAYEAAYKTYASLYPALNHKPEYLFEMAQCLSETEQYVEAKKLLERAVQLSADPMLYCVMAKNEQRLRLYPEAESHLLYALAVLPERIYPYYLLTQLYADSAFYQSEKMRAAADSVFRKKPKMESTAIREMREEVLKIINK